SGPEPVAALPAAQDDRPPRDLVDPLLRVPLDPAVERGRVRLGVGDEVAVPLRRVAERREREVAEEDRVATAVLDPAARLGRPVLAPRGRPAHEHVREAAVRQVLRQASYELGAEAVAADPA